MVGQRHGLGPVDGHLESGTGDGEEGAIGAGIGPSPPARRQGGVGPADLVGLPHDLADLGEGEECC